jgi:sugar phosphate isomerase/epimerase
MQIGIFSRTFRRDSLEGVLDAVAGHNLGAIHFNLACAGLDPLPEDLGEDDCLRIRNAFDRRGLVMVGLSGTFNAIDPDLGARRAMTRRCARLIERAPALGADLVTLCTGSRDAVDKWRWHEGNARPDAWRDLCETLDQLLPAAEAAGVMLGIEPEQGNIIRSAPLARRLLDEVRSRALRIVMDGANLLHEENLPRMAEVLTEAFDLLGPDIVSVHAKDYTGDKVQQAAGTGMLDYETYLRLVARRGYTGPIILHNLDESQVDGCVAFVRRMAARAAAAPAGEKP